MELSASVIIGPADQFFYGRDGTDKQYLLLARSGRNWNLDRDEAVLAIYLITPRVQDEPSQFLSIGRIRGELANKYSVDLVQNQIRAVTNERRGIPSHWEWVYETFYDRPEMTNYVTALAMATDPLGEMSEVGSLRIRDENTIVNGARFLGDLVYISAIKDLYDKPDEDYDLFYVANISSWSIVGDYESLDLPDNFMSSYLRPIQSAGDSRDLFVICEDL